MVRKFCPHCKEDKNWLPQPSCDDLMCECDDATHFTFLAGDTQEYIFHNVEDTCEHCHNPDDLMILKDGNFACADCGAIAELSERYVRISEELTNSAG